MDPLDLLILALRLLLVGVLYLFLLTVMRFAVQAVRSGPSVTTAAPRTASEAPSRLRLVVLEVGGSTFSPGQVLEVADGAVLGRIASADVVLADTAVSSEHARVRRAGRGWVIADLGSTNGTRLNDTPIQGESPIVAGDVLGLGNVQLKVAAR